MNPSPAAREVWRGLRCTRITLPHGDSVRVSDFGAQVLSWNARGQERMFLSDRAVLDGSAAIRGGVPVCFPQFNQRGPLPKHGLARRTTWDWLGAEVQGHAVTARWQWAAAAPLHPDFPHALQAELAVTLLPDTLQITLSATNTGSTALTFTGALHTYLQVDAIENVRLSGLCGTNYRDSANGGREGREAAEILTFAGETDRIFLGASRPLSLNDGAGQLGIAQDGFTDVVVWNPWADKGAALADLPPDGWRRMLCVEAAVAGAPLTVRPGEEWYGRQKLLID